MNSTHTVLPKFRNRKTSLEFCSRQNKDWSRLTDHAKCDEEDVCCNTFNGGRRQGYGSVECKCNICYRTSYVIRCNVRTRARTPLWQNCSYQKLKHQQNMVHNIMAARFWFLNVFEYLCTVARFLPTLSNQTYTSQRQEKHTSLHIFSSVFLSGVFCSCTNADYIQQASRDQRVQHFAKFTYSPGCHDDMFAVRLMW